MGDADIGLAGCKAGDLATLEQLSQVQEWLTAARLIQSEEKEKVGRFVFKEDALRSMVRTPLVPPVDSDSVGDCCFARQSVTSCIFHGTAFSLRGLTRESHTWSLPEQVNRG